MPLKLKDEHKQTVIGFNKSNKALGERDDLHKLFALSKNNPQILEYFSELPTEKEYEEMKVDHLIKKTKTGLKFKSDGTNARNKDFTGSSKEAQ